MRPKIALLYIGGSIGMIMNRKTGRNHWYEPQSELWTLAAAASCGESDPRLRSSQYLLQAPCPA